MVGETVNPDRNTHFGFNDISGSLREVEVPCSCYLIFCYCLQDWLEKFVSEFAHSGSCQPNQISFSVQPQDIEVHSDPSLLHQVVWNLCQNAVHHAAEDPATLRIRLVGKRLASSERPCLDIIDNGAGIDPELAEEIFEPFFTTKSSGTGLGLYIAREICESNQSHLEYIPVPEGGSCFRITFTSKETVSVATYA